MAESSDVKSAHEEYTPSNGSYAMQMFEADSMRPGMNEIVKQQSTSAYHEDDAPWGEANPDRTPEQALAEYWGDELSPTSSIVGGEGYAYESANSWSSQRTSKPMRKPNPPKNQPNGGRGNYEHDISGTLGYEGVEFENRSTTWGMDAMLAGRAESIRCGSSRPKSKAPKSTARIRT